MKIENLFILLDHEKKGNIQKEYNKLGIKKGFTYVDLKNPSEVDFPFEELENLIHKINGFSEKNALIRIAVLEILETAIKNNLPQIFIMADNAKFDGDILTILDAHIAELPEDFDVFSLEAFHFKIPELVEESELVVKVTGAWGLTAMIINNQAFEKIQELITLGFRSADLTIGLVDFLQSELKVYAPVNNIATHTNSTIPVSIADHEELELIEPLLARVPDTNLEQLWAQVKDKI